MKRGLNPPCVSWSLVVGDKYDCQLSVCPPQSDTTAECRHERREHSLVMMLQTTVVALRSEIALHDVRRLVEVIRMLGNDVGANSKADCTRELFAIECVRRRRTYLENQEKGTQSFAQHGWRCLAAVVTVRSAADKPLGSYW